MKNYYENLLVAFLTKLTYFFFFVLGREAELRQLRKSNTDYEQQNATIQTYLGGLHNAIDKLTVETQQMRNNNAALKRHLHHLRTVFTTVFTNIHVPGTDSLSIVLAQAHHF